MDDQKNIITPDDMRGGKDNKIISKMLLNISRDILADKNNIKVILRYLYAILILLDIKPEDLIEKLKDMKEIQEYEKKMKELVQKHLRSRK